MACRTKAFEEARNVESMGLSASESRLFTGGLRIYSGTLV